MVCIGSLSPRNDRSIDVMLRTNGTFAYYFNDNHGYTRCYKCIESFLDDYFIEDAVKIIKEVLELKETHIKEMRTIITITRTNIYNGDDNA